MNQTNLPNLLCQLLFPLSRELKPLTSEAGEGVLRLGPQHLAGAKGRQLGGKAFCQPSSWRGILLSRDSENGLSRAFSISERVLEALFQVGKGWGASGLGIGLQGTRGMSPSYSRQAGLARFPSPKQKVLPHVGQGTPERLYYRPGASDVHLLVGKPGAAHPDTPRPPGFHQC